MDRCHLADCILIEQVEAAATVHEDSREVESINNWIEDQRDRTSMTDTGRVVSAIKSDRVGRPWVELWGDWLHRVDVPKRAFAPPLGDMGSVYHVHRFDLRGKLLLSPCVRRTGLLVIILTL